MTLVCAGLLFAVTAQAGSGVWKATLDVPAADQLYRLQIPLQVYDSAQDSLLRDVRIYNAAGAALPFAWIGGQATAPGTIAETPVPMFPLIGTPGHVTASDLDVTVSRDASGAVTAVATRGQARRGAKTTLGEIFDLSRVRGDPRGLVFADYSATDRLNAFRLDASDDLRTWRTLRQEAHIVRLTQGGETVQQNRVDLGESPGDSARYLRLVWLDAQNAPQLRTVKVRTSSLPPQAMLWTEPQAPVAENGDIFEYRAPAALPIERLRVNLRRTDLMTPIKVYAPVTAPVAAVLGSPAAGTAPAATGTMAAPSSAASSPASAPGAAMPGATPPAPTAWTERVQGLGYRLETGVGEIVSPDLLLDGRPMPRFQVQILQQGARIEDAAPTVQIGFSPRSLVFRAQGPGPYTLTWGAPGQTDGSVSPQSLIPGYQDPAGLPDTILAVYAGQREHAASTLTAQSPQSAAQGAPEANPSARTAAAVTTGTTPAPVPGSRSRDRMLAALLFLGLVSMLAVALGCRSNRLGQAGDKEPRL